MIGILIVAHGTLSDSLAGAVTHVLGTGLDVTEQVPIEMQPNDENRRYLAAKRDKLGHRLHHQGLKFESESE